MATSSMISTYVSISTSILLFRSMVDSFIPYAMRNHMLRKLCSLLLLRSPSTLTLVIEEYGGITQNQLYSAAETYLSSRISPDIQRVRVSKSAKEDNLSLQFDRDEKIDDTFEGIEVKWVFVCTQYSQPRTQGDLGLQFVRPSRSVLSSLSKQECRSFELSFHQKHKERVLGSYLPYILERSKAIRDAEKIVRLHTFVNAQVSQKNIWESVILRHPSTFETLAMDVELKKAIMDDLDRFVRRKEFYNKVGRAWKRGYLLYGPPGTGKSSLIAAMANYLRFSIYDLQLSNITRDADLRKLLLTTSNKSILVIEDIDCSVDLPDRKKRDDSQMSLSGLLNFIDGLWSCCGDERIIIFTTNHKERIDPALLRPGRMDMHIHMSYCTPQAFKILASNYLGISGYHPLFPEIEGMLQSAEVSPAEVAEELMKSEDADVSLGGVVNLLKRKRTKASEIQDGDEDPDQLNEAKRQKVAKSGRTN